MRGDPHQPELPEGPFEGMSCCQSFRLSLPLCPRNQEIVPLCNKVMRSSAERVYFFPNRGPHALVSNSINPVHPEVRFPSICDCRDRDRTRDVQLGNPDQPLSGFWSSSTRTPV